MRIKKRQTSCHKPTIFEKRCFYLLFQQIQYIVFFLFSYSYMSKIHLYLNTIVNFQCQEWISTIISVSNFFSVFLLLIFFVKKEFVKSSNRFLSLSKSISIVIPVESSSTIQQLLTIYKTV